MMAGRKRIAAKILRLAAKAIEQNGWIQGQFGDESIGFCALGGINHARYKFVETIRFDDLGLAKRALMKFINRGIAAWNDSDYTTKSEVVRTMRKAAAALEHGLKA